MRRIGVCYSCNTSQKVCCKVFCAIVRTCLGSHCAVYDNLGTLTPITCVGCFVASFVQIEVAVAVIFVVIT